MLFLGNATEFFSAFYEVRREKLWWQGREGERYLEILVKMPKQK